LANIKNNFLKNFYIGDTAIIIITHEMNVARHAKRIIQIRDGKVISDDKIKI